MENNISIVKLINNLKTSNFLLGCEMPLGYCPGLPTVQIKNDNVCVVIPYLRYKVTGVVDKTLVFPIRYVVCVKYPEGNVVQYSDLSVTSSCKKLDFTKPVGLFRHDSIKNLTKDTYNQKRKELMSLYDKLLSSLVNKTEFTTENENSMRTLLKLLVEPSLLPLYKAIDLQFYNKYLT